MQSNESQKNELKCDGCGQQFSNRQDLEKHRSTCAMARNKSGSGQQPATRGAGGGSQGFNG
jgi:hypothetical protein